MGRNYNLSKRASKDVRGNRESVELEGYTNEATGEHHVHHAEDSKKKVGFFELFRFSDRVDKLLMLVGTIAACGHGIAIQSNFIILSKTLDLFANSTIVVDNVTMPDKERLEGSIWKIVVSYSTVAFAVMLCGFLNVLTWCLAAERQVKVIRRLAFNSVLRQHIGWFDKQQSGQITTRLTSDIYNIQAGIGDKVATFIQWTGTFIAGTIICMIRTWKLTLAMLTVSPICLIVAAVAAKLLQKAAAKESEENSAAGAIAGEVFTNIRTVTAYSGQDKEASRYMKHLRVVRDVGFRRGIVAGVGQGSFWLLVFITLGFGMWLGAYLFRTEGNPTIGTVMQVVISLVSGTRALSFAVNNLDYFSMARGGAASIFPLIDAASEIDSMSEEGKRPSSTEGNIKFHDVYFSYPTNQTHTILNGISLELIKGKTMALVGSSGCGKSTLVQCIQRFYDPTSGKITLDDVDLRNLNINWLRQQIGIVSQEPMLFSTSIKENIMMGRDNVTFEEVQQAAKEANAHNFIMSLPDKYDTLVGSKGGQMSGGQKQRIAIARALVRNPRILILDDATSALDYQSESIVQDALDKARKGRTMLIIAHRLSTIRNADIIGVLDEGQIVETGSHEDLVHKGGIYANLISRQTTDDSEEEAEESEDEGDLGEMTKLGTSPIIEQFNRQISQVSDNTRRSSRSISSRGSVRRTRKRTMTETKEKKAIVEEKEPEPAPLGRILKLNAPEIPLLIIGCIAAAVQGGIFPSLAFIMSEILAVFNKPSDEQQEAINSNVLILCLCGLIAGSASVIMIIMFTISGEKLTLRLRDRAFRAMLTQEMGWYDSERNQVGSLTSRLASDAAMVKAATGTHLSTLVNSFSTVTLGLTLALVFEWRLALVCIAFIPLLIATGFAQSHFLLGFARGSKKSMEEGGTLVSEAVDNIRTVASLTKEDHFLEKYLSHFDSAYKEGKRRAIIYGISWGLSQSVFFFAYAANYGYGAYLIANSGTNFENVFRVFVAVSSGAVELGRINAFAADYTKAKISASKLFALFERKSEIDPTDKSGDKPTKFEGQVKFQNIAFRYPTRPEAQVLKDMNVSVDPGQTLALVGASGCGKSTSVSILERFYDPEGGIVSVDGHNIRRVNLEWLRSKMGIVAQEPMLFETTIRANIAYGDQNRDIPMEEIISAARQSNIHDFICKLPKGYETELGAKGVQLVGGQKQRIAIARALIRNPKILLLDEATSALDTENEKVVQEALDKAQKGRTCIVIAHRLSTIENADIIAVIDQGVVAESGRHSDLMEKRGLYFMLQMIQSGAKTDHS